jgi:hypothetical protein
MVAESAAMRELARFAYRVATSEVSTIVIQEPTTRRAVSVTGGWKSIPPSVGADHAVPVKKRLAAPSAQRFQALLRMILHILRPDA